MLKDVLPLVLPEDCDSYEVQQVQASCTDSGARHDAVVDDDVNLHLEFRRRFFFSSSWATALLKERQLLRGRQLLRSGAFRRC